MGQLLAVCLLVLQINSQHLPLQFEDYIPYVNVEISQQPLKLAVDSKFADTLVFLPSVNAKNELALDPKFEFESSQAEICSTSLDCRLISKKFECKEPTHKLPTRFPANDVPAFDYYASALNFTLAVGQAHLGYDHFRVGGLTLEEANLFFVAGLKIKPSDKGSLLWPGAAGVFGIGDSRFSCRNEPVFGALLETQNNWIHYKLHPFSEAALVAKPPSSELKVHWAPPRQFDPAQSQSANQFLAYKPQICRHQMLEDTPFWLAEVRVHEPCLSLPQPLYESVTKWSSNLQCPQQDDDKPSDLCQVLGDLPTFEFYLTVNSENLWNQTHSHPLKYEHLVGVHLKDLVVNQQGGPLKPGEPPYLCVRQNAPRPETPRPSSFDHLGVIGLGSLVISSLDRRGRTLVTKRDEDDHQQVGFLVPSTPLKPAKFETSRCAPSVELECRGEERFSSRRNTCEHPDCSLASYGEWSFASHRCIFPEKTKYYFCLLILVGFVLEVVSLFLYRAFVDKVNKKD